MSKVIGLRRILPLAALAGLGAITVGIPTSQGADPFVAGQPSTRTVEVPAAQAERVTARGRQLATALGLPGVSQRAERLQDRFEHRTYDEVTSLDAAGREVAIARFETDGTVAMAIVLGWQPGHGSRVDPASAERRGRAIVRAAGLVVDGPSSVHASSGSGGWSITWSRVVDGIPVRGDGVRVSLWADGTFHGLMHLERPLAAAPIRQLAVGAARQEAETWAAGRYPAASPSLRVSAVDRAWLAPNGAFSANGLDAPAETLRLAWVVRFEASGPLAEGLRSVEVWLDAGDGSVLGGDVIE